MATEGDEISLQLLHIQGFVGRTLRGIDQDFCVDGMCFCDDFLS